MKFSEKVGNRPVNKRLNFGGDTGKTCLGGGMNCPIASSFMCDNKLHVVLCPRILATPVATVTIQLLRWIK